MDSRNRLDMRYIAQHEHDHESGAKKVKMVATEMAIELDASDGDSVLSHRLHRSTAVKGEEIDAKGLSDLRVYISSGSLDIEVSPVDSGDVWFPLALSISASTDLSLNAARVRMSGSGEGYMVGRS